jgi:hypothetical protein
MVSDVIVKLSGLAIKLKQHHQAISTTELICAIFNIHFVSETNLKAGSNNFPSYTSILCYFLKYLFMQ